MKCFFAWQSNQESFVPRRKDRLLTPAFVWQHFSLFCVLLGLCFVLPAHAIVDARTQDNTNAPPDGAPWDHMGQVNGVGCIYIGGGWVLTAAHAGVGDVNLGGVPFPWDGNFIRLTNSDGGVVDAHVFHLKTAPHLTWLAMSSNAPTPLEAVDLIGFGYRSGSAQMNFGLGVTGFYLSSSAGKSWGSNQINPPGQITFDDGFGTNYGFIMDFSPPPGQTTDEAQAESGDSGGGVFHKNGSVWELAGVILAKDDTLTNRPPNTVAYGDLSFALDVSTYRQQILSIIQATPVALSITGIGDAIQLCWIDTGASYTLEAATNLSVPNWTPISPNLSSSNGQICTVLPATNSAIFFRLHQQ